MKHKTEDFSAELSPAVIDEISDKIRIFLASQKLAGSDIVRYALACEEILLKTMDSFGEGAPVTVSFGVRFFHPFINVRIKCDAHNVYAQKESEQGILGNGILKSLGLSPDYSYSGNENTYFFRIRKKTRNPFATLSIALLSAAVCGALGLLFPQEIRTEALTYLFEPLHDTFSNLLNCIAGPMMFLAVAWGIYGIGDVATLRKIGKKMILSYIGTVYVFVLVFGLIGLGLFNLNFAGVTDNTSEFSSVISIILGIIPKNIFTPFVDGNTLQIIFLAVVIGIAMLFLGQKTKAVAKAIEQINLIVQFLIEFISRLVPYFIFIVTVSMIWSDSLGIFFKLIKLFAIFLIMVLTMLVIYIAITSIRNKISPFLLIKKGLPTLFIALTTVSSAAAFGTNVKACRNQYGIDDTISSFGIPLGMVTFKPATALSYLMIALFYAEIYNIEISVSWVLVMILSVGILAIATPPVPGGALTAYTVLFSQLGIPTEAIAVVLAIDTIFDFIDTGIDQFLIPLALLNQAQRHAMVNKKILHKK